MRGVSANDYVKISVEGANALQKKIVNFIVNVDDQKKEKLCMKIAMGLLRSMRVGVCEGFVTVSV